MMDGQCGHIKTDGGRCRGRARENGFCPLPGHAPKVGVAQAAAPHGDPDVIGARLAEEMAAEQVQSRLRQGHKLASRDRDGMRNPEDDTKRVPIKVVPKRVRPDSTSIIDPITGLPPEGLRRGYVTRWVRDKDHLDRPMTQRIVEYEDYGYEVIRDAKGQPLKSHFGIAMQAPPPQYALRVQDKSHVGALNKGDLVENAQELVEQANRAVDHEALRLVTQNEHGGGRFFHEDASPVE